MKAILLVAMTLAVAPAAMAEERVQFSPAETRRILSHGPWPPPANPDASNRVSGEPDAIALGEALFFDAGLSRDGTVSCATCHVPERGWSDGRRTAVGLAPMDRNTPGLLNGRLNRWFGWDGASDSLWHSAIRPLLDEREMGASPKHVADHLTADAALACRYRRAFGALADDDTKMVNAAKAIAAFQETLTSARTPFDEFRDALDPARYQVEVVHLGNQPSRLAEARSLGVQSVPALAMDGKVYHINFGAALSALEPQASAS